MSTSATIPDLKRGFSLDAPPRRVPLLAQLQMAAGNTAFLFGVAFILPFLAVPFFGIGVVGGDALAFVMLTPVSILIMFAASIDSRRTVRLMRHGRLAWGVRTAEPVEIRGAGNYRRRVLNFHFVDDKGSQRTAVTRAGRTEDLMDGREEPLLYDDKDAMLLDEEYARPRIIDGKLTLARRWPLALALVNLAIVAAYVAICVGCLMGRFRE